jgi:hypothetical protein
MASGDHIRSRDQLGDQADRANRPGSRQALSVSGITEDNFRIHILASSRQTTRNYKEQNQVPRIYSRFRNCGAHWAERARGTAAPAQAQF